MLRSKFVVTLLAGLWIAGEAGAASTATLSVNGGGPIAIPLELAGKPDLYCAADVGCTNPNLSAAGWNASVFVELNPDPYITWTIEVENTSGGPLTFEFVFTQDIVLTPAPGNVANGISYGLTNGENANGVTVTPLGGPVPVDSDGIPELSVFQLSTNGGGTFTNAGVDVGPAFSTANPSQNAPDDNEAAAGPLLAGNYNFMRLALSFTLTGDTGTNGDRLSGNGTAEVVPEPETAVLTALGLVALAYASRRRA
jgi:PEP-CTERM motif